VKRLNNIIKTNLIIFVIALVLGANAMSVQKLKGTLGTFHSYGVEQAPAFNSLPEFQLWLTLGVGVNT